MQGSERPGVVQARKARLCSGGQAARDTAAQACRNIMTTCEAADNVSCPLLPAHIKLMQLRGGRSGSTATPARFVAEADIRKALEPRLSVVDFPASKEEYRKQKVRAVLLDRYKDALLVEKDQHNIRQPRGES